MRPFALAGAGSYSRPIRPSGLTGWLRSSRSVSLVSTDTLLPIVSQKMVNAHGAGEPPAESSSAAPDATWVQPID